MKVGCGSDGYLTYHSHTWGHLIQPLLALKGMLLDGRVPVLGPHRILLFFLSHPICPPFQFNIFRLSDPRNVKYFPFLPSSFFFPIYSVCAYHFYQVLKENDRESSIASSSSPITTYFTWANSSSRQRCRTCECNLPALQNSVAPLLTPDRQRFADQGFLQVHWSETG